MSGFAAWARSPGGTAAMMGCVLVFGVILGWLHATRRRGDVLGEEPEVRPAGRHRAGVPLPAAGRLPMLAEGEGRRVWAELMANDRPRPDAILGAHDLAVIRVARGGRPVPDVPSPPWVPPLVPAGDRLAADLPVAPAREVRYDGSYDANGWDENTVLGPAERALLMPAQPLPAEIPVLYGRRRPRDAREDPDLISKIAAAPEPAAGAAGEELYGTAWTRQAALDLAAWMDEHVYSRPGTYAEITARLDGQP